MQAEASVAASRGFLVRLGLYTRYLMVAQAHSDGYSLGGRVEIFQRGLKELEHLLTLGKVGGQLQQGLQRGKGKQSAIVCG